MINNADKFKSNRGITLISLIVVVIVLLILAAVSIRTGLGSKGLIDTVDSVAENYEIAQEKEQINQLFESIIIRKELLGETITFESIAEELKAETEIVADAVATEGQDIIVSGIDGNLYELFYDASYGQKYIEYIGKASRKTPEISNVSYDEENLKINYKSDVSNIELIYAGEIIDNINITDDGWYILKATSSDGNLRYAWIRVSHVKESIQIPKIEVVKEIDSENRLVWKK